MDRSLREDDRSTFLTVEDDRSTVSAEEDESSTKEVFAAEKKALLNLVHKQASIEVGDATCGMLYLFIYLLLLLLLF